MMQHSFIRTAAATACVLWSASATLADPVKNIVLVHGAFVDGSIWNGVSAWPTGHAAILSRPGASASLISQAARALDTPVSE